MAMNEVYAAIEPARADIDMLEGPTVLEFGSPTCGYCRAAQPLLATALADHPRVRHIKIADGSGRRLGRSFRVKLWPTLVFLGDGREIARLVRPGDENAIRSALAQIDAVGSGTVLPRVAAGVMLRRLTGADLPAFQAYRADPQLGLYQGWSPMPDDKALAFLSEMSTAPLFRPGSWTQIGIAEAPGRHLSGDIGLFLSEDGRHAEIGFTLARHAQGRGVATKAVREAIGLIFDCTSVDRVLGVTDVRNSASVRLLERVGMERVEIRSTVFRGGPCEEYVYAVTRRDG